jgi:hypothetical protein
MTTDAPPMSFEATTPPTLFVAFADPPAARDDEFNVWYDTVHGPDALENGSFTAMHRFRAVGDGHRSAPYLALWEGRFDTEAEAWGYIAPRAQALREAGRVGDIASVRFAVMLFGTGTPSGARCDPVRSLTTVQNDWRCADDAPAADEWWASTGLDDVPSSARWLATSDAAGKGAGYHLGVFPHSEDVGDLDPVWSRIGAAGMSPLPPYQTIFGDETDDATDDEPAPAPAWVMHWQPVTSLRA